MNQNRVPHFVAARASPSFRIPLPLRLAILGDSPCDLCTAACCRQNGHDYAVLLEGERERRKFAAFAVDVPVEQGESDSTPGAISIERVLPYHAGRCRFLGD